MLFFFFFKQKTAYEMRISDWSSDVCSSDLVGLTTTSGIYFNEHLLKAADASGSRSAAMVLRNPAVDVAVLETARRGILRDGLAFRHCQTGAVLNVRSAEHTSELQSLMRISYAVFCLKKNTEQLLLIL